MKKKVVVIGGGNGSAIALQALKAHKERFDISAVISMFDSGGSQAKLMREFHTLPHSDIMRAVLSLSKYDYAILRQIFYKTRMRDVGHLSKQNLGNIFMFLTTQHTGDILKTVEILSQAVEAEGKVYPVTLEKADIVAELSNGEKVKGEKDIDEPTYDRSLRIKKMWHEPNVSIYERAAIAIEKADYVLVGPGSLYTSIVSTLLTEGMSEVIQQSKAKLIFIPPHFFATDKETGPQKLSEMVKECKSYLPRDFDIILYDDYAPDEKMAESYRKERHWELLIKDRENLSEENMKKCDIIEHGAGMDWKKLSSALSEVLV